MQPSSNWGNDGRYSGGLNTRGVNITDADYTAIPPFIYSSHATAPEQKEFIAWFYNDTFPINNPIEDWSVAYTAVDNSELSMNNIGVFLDDPDTPEYVTDNTEYQKIAFYSSITYNLTRSALGLTTVGQYRRFYGLPYSNNYYNWSPDCHTNAYAGSTYNFLHDSNYQGYAVMYKSFGIRALFLEIHVKIYHLQGTVVSPDLTLKEYASLSQQDRDDNPIGAAYAQVYIRSSTSGNYATTSHDYGDIQAINALGLSDGTNTIYNYFSGVQLQGATPKIVLPLWGFPNAGMSSTGTYISHVNADNNGELFYGYDKIDGSVLDPHTDYYYCYKYMNGTDENIEYLRKCCAAYGLFFCDREITDDLVHFADSSAENTRWTHDEMHLGIIEEDGYTRGRYTSGSENANQVQFNWSDSTESTFDPEIRPDSDPNHYETSTPLPSNRLTIGAANCWTDVTLGSINPTMIINNAIDAITDLAASVYTDETDALTAIANRERLKEFGFQEPLQTILDYRRIFLTQPHQRASSSTPIILGRFTSLDPDKPFVGYDNFSLFRRETLGSFTFWRTYKNFLDFEPYTQASLYVPFCGMKQLPMNIFMGHTVNIYLNACNLTGELEVLIFVDNMEWGTMQGIAAEELPLTATNAMTAAQEIRNLQYQQDMASWQGAIGMAGSIAGASISAANRNPTGLIAQGVTAALKYHSMQRQTNELQYRIDHTKPEITAIQKGAPTIESINVLTPFILLQTPVITGGEYEDVKQKYGKTKGFKCCVSGNLGDFSGLTVCSTANLDGISCTYTEKQMILEALQEGVILDWE